VFNGAKEEATGRYAPRQAAAIGASAQAEKAVGRHQTVFNGRKEDATGRYAPR
jgi:hypothetical protein